MSRLLVVSLVMVLCFELCLCQRSNWWRRYPTQSPLSPSTPSPASPSSPTPSPIRNVPTFNPTVLGSCDTDLPIDVVLILDQDCLPEESDNNECSALHGFIQNIARAFGDGATDVRFAILLHGSSGASQTLFDFEFWEANKYILIDSPFLAEMPCRPDDLTEENVDPAAQLTSAMALLQSQSSIDRIRKILMVNTCDPTLEDAEDTVCSAMPALLEALDIELILINAAYDDSIDLQLYTCLIDVGQLNSEYYAFAEISDEVLAAADGTIINQICSPNDVRPEPTTDPTPNPTPNPTTPPSKEITTPSPTVLPTSRCDTISFDLAISIVVDSQCPRDINTCDAQNSFLRDVIGRILPAGDDVVFNLIRIDLDGNVEELFTFTDSENLSVEELQDRVYDIGCETHDSTTTVGLSQGLLTSISRLWSRSGDDHKILILNYCPAEDESVVCLMGQTMAMVPVDPILINIGDNVDEDTNDCLITDENNGVSYYVENIIDGEFEDANRLAWSVSNTLCHPDNVNPTDPPTRLLTPQPSSGPTDSPTTGQPTTRTPTNRPTDRPTDRPTNNPSNPPSEEPSKEPSSSPSDKPSDKPTENPTTTGTPTTSTPTTRSPTRRPISPGDPTYTPTGKPTPYPTWSNIPTYVV